LVNLVAQLKENRPVTWDTDMSWDLLGIIRNDLDLLLHPVKSSSGSGLVNNLSRLGTEVAHIFRRGAGDWTVSYRGSHTFALRNTAGAMYIHHLLQHPGLDIAVADIAAVWDRFNILKRCPDAAADGLKVGVARDDGPVLDEIGMDECRKKYEDLNYALEEAEKNNDTGRIVQVKTEFQQFAKAFSEATKPGGKSVIVGDNFFEVRSSKEL
jgi:hypothetical protein